MAIVGGWEAEGGLNYPLAQRKSHCVFSKAQKQPQCTCQDKMVVGSSLSPHAALLVHPSGTTHPVVDHHGFTYAWSDKCCLSQPCQWSVWIVLRRVWLSSVLPALCQVLTNPVTYILTISRCLPFFRVLFFPQLRVLFFSQLRVAMWMISFKTFDIKPNDLLYMYSHNMTLLRSEDIANSS